VRLSCFIRIEAGLRWRAGGTVSSQDDAVFAGDRAAEAHGEIEDLLHREFDAGHFGGVPFVSEKGRVQVAVTHVAEGADLQIMPCAASWMKRIIFESHCAAGGVFENGRRDMRASALNADGARWQDGRIPGVCATCTLVAPQPFRDFDHLRGLILHSGGMAVGFS